MTFENLLPLEEVDNYQNPKITHHFINNITGWQWWIVAGEKISEKDYYFFGIGEITHREMGFITLSQIIEYGGTLDEEWNNEIGLYDVMK